MFYKACTNSSKCSTKYVVTPANVLQSITNSSRCSTKHVLTPANVRQSISNSSKCSTRYVVLLKCSGRHVLSPASVFISRVLKKSSVLQGIYSLHQVVYNVCTRTIKCSAWWPIYTLKHVFYTLCTCPNNMFCTRYVLTP